MYIAPRSVHDLKPGSLPMGRIATLSLLLFNKISCVLCTWPPVYSWTKQRISNQDVVIFLSTEGWVELNMQQWCWGKRAGKKMEIQKSGKSQDYFGFAKQWKRVWANNYSYISKINSHIFTFEWTMEKSLALFYLFILLII